VNAVDLQGEDDLLVRDLSAAFHSTLDW